jgi:hypothetical protein
LHGIGPPAKEAVPILIELWKGDRNSHGFWEPGGMGTAAKRARTVRSPFEERVPLDTLDWIAEGRRDIALDLYKIDPEAEAQAGIPREQPKPE